MIDLGPIPAGPTVWWGRQAGNKQTDIRISVCAEGREEKKAGSRIDPIELARRLSVTELIREGFFEEVAFELSPEGWKEEHSRQRAQHVQRSGGRPVPGMLDEPCVARVSKGAGRGRGQVVQGLGEDLGLF